MNERKYNITDKQADELLGLTKVIDIHSELGWYVYLNGNDTHPYAASSCIHQVLKTLELEQFYTPPTDEEIKAAIYNGG